MSATLRAWSMFFQFLKRKKNSILDVAMKVKFESTIFRWVDSMPHWNITRMDFTSWITSQSLDLSFSLAESTISSKTRHKPCRSAGPLSRSRWEIIRLKFEGRRKKLLCSSKSQKNWSLPERCLILIRIQKSAKRILFQLWRQKNRTRAQVLTRCVKEPCKVWITNRNDCETARVLLSLIFN